MQSVALSKTNRLVHVARATDVHFSFHAGSERFLKINESCEKLLLKTLFTSFRTNKHGVLSVSVER
jgi:hypothetical protein